MFKPFLLFCSLFLSCMLTASAQKLQLSVEGGLQQSWIPDYTEKPIRVPVSSNTGYSSYTLQENLEYSYKERPAGYLSANLSYTVGSRLSLYHNLGFSMLRFQPKTRMKDLQSNDTQYPTGGDEPSICYRRNSNGELEEVPCNNTGVVVMGSRSEDWGKTAMVYVVQDMGAAYQLGSRWQVRGGVSLNYRLYSQVLIEKIKYTSSSPTGGESGYWGSEYSYTVEEVKDTKGTGFNPIVLGLHVGGAYAISEQLSVMLQLQHSLTPLYNQEMYQVKGHEQSKSNLLRLGVEYRLKSW